jgi:hypothetical protein
MNMNARDLTRAVRLTAATALALVSLAGTAWAGDSDDVVFLRNGGRLRGMVIEDDPATVTIKLPDGTVRALARAKVKQIEYGATNPAIPPAAAVPLPPPVLAPGPAAPPAGWRYGPEGAPPPARTERRSTGLMVTGIVFMPLGFLTVGTALAACAGAFGDGCNHGSTRGPVEGTIAIGSLLLVSGIVFTAVGASRRPVGGAALAPVNFQLGATMGPRSVALVGAF